MSNINQIIELSKNIENELDTTEQIDPVQLQKLKLLQMKDQIAQMEKMQYNNSLNNVIKSADFLGFTPHMFKETILVVFLYILFSVGAFNSFLGSYIPILNNLDDGSTSIVTLIARGIVVGGVYLFIKRFFISIN